MSNFNLSIEDYNINEMKDLLNLVDPYTLEDIVNNENELREKLLIDPNVSSNKKEGITKFLQTTKEILIKSKKKEFSSLPSDELFGNSDHAVAKRGVDAMEKINAVPRDETAVSGVSKNTMQKLLCIDSKFRDNYYNTISTNYTQTLPTVIKNVVSMQLASLEFPTTYYQVSKALGNNYFWIKWLDPVNHRLESLSSPAGNGEPWWYYISMPDGNYPRKPAMHILNEQLLIATQPRNALIYYLAHHTPVLADKDESNWTGVVAHPQVTIDQFSTKTVISYVKGTVKYTGSDVPTGTAAIAIQEALNNPTTVDLSIYFNRATKGGATPYLAAPPLPSPENSPYSGGQDEEPKLDKNMNGGIVKNFGWTLGYRVGFYNNATAYVSEGCYDAWGVKYIYIVVNDFNKNVNNFCIPSYNESLGKTNILARIGTNGVSSIDFQAGLSLTNNINDDSSIKTRYYFGPVDISKLQIQITDEYGRILDLNNMDYSMAINFLCLYD